MALTSSPNAKSTVKLNTSVTDIVKDSSTGSYRLHWRSASSSSEAEEQYSGNCSSPYSNPTFPENDVFDAVIIATPYQFANLTLHGTSSAPPEPIPYVKLFVSIFTSPYLLSPEAFNLPLSQPVPQVILTTLQPNEHLGSDKNPEGSPGFFSISLLRPIRNPKTQKIEYLYKVFSANAIDSAFLTKILGHPASIPSGTKTPVKGTDSAAAATVGTNESITWFHEKVWYSYPYELPRITFDRIHLDDGLWYTGSMESLVSAMEAMALVGMNVARLVVDEGLQQCF